jgi:cell volume regulation protein A
LRLREQVALIWEDDVYPTLTLIAFLVLLSLAVFPLARRSGTPFLLIVLGIGMLAGEDGPGGIDFDDFRLAYDLGSIALAVILFAGGIETERRIPKKVIISALLLAIPGVLITVGIVGGLTHLALGIPILTALLLGAVIAPTDAAATFMLFQHGNVSVPKKVKDTLFLESGLNDPVSIGLTVALTAFIATSNHFDTNSLLGSSYIVVVQIVSGIIGGLIGGWLLTALMNKLPVPVGLYPVLAFVGGLFVFGLVGMLGGSGFMAIYIAGAVVRNRLVHPVDRIMNFSEGLQWIAQLLVFLLLGLLVTPSQLASTLVPALICAAILMFVARPIAVFVTLGASRFSFKELTFISWMGLRGAVPILLSIYPIIEPGPISHVFFNIVFVVVVSSLLLQGFTASFLGQKLALDRKDDAADK